METFLVTLYKKRYSLFGCALVLPVLLLAATRFRIAATDAQIKETLNALRGLFDEFAKKGVKLEIDSSYRSIETQQHLWDWDLEHRGEEYTRLYVAHPGFSEHHTGLAVDIFVDKDGKRVYRDKDGNSFFSSMIHPRLASYGFILRYPEGKEDITGYGYEPWHIRYVGSAELAAEIYEKGLTLEEYLADK